VYLYAVRNIYKIRNLSTLCLKKRANFETVFFLRQCISSELFHILTRDMRTKPKTDLDLSVEWFQLLFRKIKITSMKAIVWLSWGH